MKLSLKSLIAIIILLVVISCNSKNETQKPNILFILADDLGYADLGCYGSTFYETPNLDNLAADGIQFTNGYANCPVCSPSRASVQTGKYPNVTGVTDWIPGRAAYRNGTPKDRWLSGLTKTELDLEEKTIAEVLKENGYATFFAGKWHLGETEEFWPEHQGYDINMGGYKKGSPNRNLKEGCNGYFAPYCNPRLQDGPEGEYLPERLVAETSNFIDSIGKEPFFVCLSFYLVHTPLQAKEETINKYKAKRTKLGLDTIPDYDTAASWIQYATTSNSYKERKLQSHPTYASMVESLDVNIGKVINKLKEKGLYENTIIVFTSDNGGLSTAEGSPTINQPLRAGKGWLYEGGIRVPYILKYPGNENTGTTNDLPVAGMDIMPTLLSLSGIEKEIPNIDGIDISPSLNGEEIPERPLFWHYPHYSNQGGNPGSIIRFGDYKLIDDFETGKKELYNLKEDIAEQNDLSEELPEITEKLYLMLEEWRKKVNTKMLVPNPDWDEKEPVIK